MYVKPGATPHHTTPHHTTPYHTCASQPPPLPRPMWADNSWSRLWPFHRQPSLTHPACARLPMRAQSACTMLLSTVWLLVDVSLGSTCWHDCLGLGSDCMCARVAGASDTHRSCGCRGLSRDSQHKRRKTGGRLNVRSPPPEPPPRFTSHSPGLRSPSA